MQVGSGYGARLRCRHCVVVFLAWLQRMLEAVRRLTMGHDDDLDAFCARLHPQLVGSLTLFTGDRGLAEDIAQEALVRIVEGWESVRHKRSPAAWTQRVVTNLAISRLRRRRVGQRALALVGRREPMVHTDPDVAEGVAVREALAGLPDRQRAVLVLRFYGGLSVAETAVACGVPEGTVKSHTHRALARLREVLDVDMVVPEVAEEVRR